MKRLGVPIKVLHGVEEGSCEGFLRVWKRVI